MMQFNPISKTREALLNGTILLVEEINPSPAHNNPVVAKLDTDDFTPADIRRYNQDRSLPLAVRRVSR